MKRTKLNWSIQFLFISLVLYLLIIGLELPFVSNIPTDKPLFDHNINPNTKPHVLALDSQEDLQQKQAPFRPINIPLIAPKTPSNSTRKSHSLSLNLSLSTVSFDLNSLSNESFGFGFGDIKKSASEAFLIGKKIWEEIESGRVNGLEIKLSENRTINESCPNSIVLSGSVFRDQGSIIALPCGMTLGSQVTVVGRPREARVEKDSKISLLKSGEYLMVSQFMMELQGLKTVDGEDPPRILHFNPRLKGDWSGKPVIEQNTCYRMQWGSAHRCDGWKSRPDEETVDGEVKCEKWIRDDDDHTEEKKTSWWLNRLIGRTKKAVTVDWPYPFAEGKLFVLTLSAGLEGYHVNVDGRHITSFPYRTGFALEDATGLALNGDIDVNAVFAASLPSTHPSFAPQRHLEMSDKWRAPPIPDGPVDMFIGVLSAGNHFAERMAVRKSWMQHSLIKSSRVVARFFVALHARKEVNVELKKEAEYFGDIVIVPYMDNYDLVVLKTVAICEYGVRTVSAKYIMKCDDDTFVRVDSSLNEANKIGDGKSLYIGNMNYYHKPLRSGKWSVTYEEWPEEDYPPYANGPGYIISSDVADFIATEFEEHKLKLFKMEDVSMGMWVGQFNSTKRVEYVHNSKFCQFGCIEDYYTAHYQSPRQMLCLWNKLQIYGRPQCCNMR